MSAKASNDTIAPSQSGVTIERLRSFCEIVAAGSMVAAADGDPIKQSHYSRQVKDLETAMDVKLFTKIGKFLRPTDQGKQLAALTNLYFSSLQGLKSEKETGRSEIRVAAGEAVLRWLIFPHLSEVLAALDQHLIEFVPASTDAVIDGVRTGRFEVGIVRDDAVDESLTAIECGELDYAFVVPRSLLPGRSAAGIEHMRKLPVAALAGGGQFARNSIELLKRNGVEPIIRVRTQSFSLIIDAVRTGGVAAFVPAPAAQEFPQDQFAIIELSGIDRLGRKLFLVYEPTASSLRPVARTLGAKIAQICAANQRV